MLGLGDYGEYIGQNKAKQNSQSNNNQNGQKNQQNSANPIKFSQPPTITRQSSNSSIGSLQNYTNQTPIQPDSQNKNDITGLWRDLSTDEYSIIDDDSDALPDSLFSSPSDINNSLLLKPQQKIQEPAQSSIPEVDGYPEKPPKSSSYHFFGTLSSDTSMEPIEDKKQADSITIPAEEDNNQNEDAKEEQNDENQVEKTETDQKTTEKEIEEDHINHEASSPQEEEIKPENTENDQQNNDNDQMAVFGGYPQSDTNDQMAPQSDLFGYSASDFNNASYQDPMLGYPTTDDSQNDNNQAGLFSGYPTAENYNNSQQDNSEQSNDTPGHDANQKNTDNQNYDNVFGNYPQSNYDDQNNQNFGYPTSENQEEENKSTNESDQTEEPSNSEESSVFSTPNVSQSPSIEGIPPSSSLTEQEINSNLSDQVYEEDTALGIDPSNNNDNFDNDQQQNDDQSQDNLFNSPDNQYNDSQSDIFGQPPQDASNLFSVPPQNQQQPSNLFNPPPKPQEKPPSIFAQPPAPQKPKGFAPPPKQIQNRYPSTNIPQKEQQPKPETSTPEPKQQQSTLFAPPPKPVNNIPKPQPQQKPVPQPTVQQPQKAQESNLFGQKQPTQQKIPKTSQQNSNLFGQQQQDNQEQQQVNNLFGQQQPNQQSNLFNQQPQDNQQENSSLFGSSNDSSSLFGQPEENQQQNIFNQPPKQEKQPEQSQTNASKPNSSLFGQQKPEQKSNIFNQPPKQEKPPQQIQVNAPKQSSSLFGQQQPEQQSNLFNQLPQENKQSGTSLFEAPNTSSNLFDPLPQDNQSNLFNQQPQEEQQSGSDLFSSPNNSSSLFGQVEPSEQQNIFNQSQPDEDKKEEEMTSNLFGTPNSSTDSLFASKERLADIAESASMIFGQSETEPSPVSKQDTTTPSWAQPIKEEPKQKELPSWAHTLKEEPKSTGLPAWAQPIKDTTTPAWALPSSGATSWEAWSKNVKHTENTSAQHSPAPSPVSSNNPVPSLNIPQTTVNPSAYSPQTSPQRAPPPNKVNQPYIPGMAPTKPPIVSSPLAPQTNKQIFVPNNAPPPNSSKPSIMIPGVTPPVPAPSQPTSSAPYIPGMSVQKPPTAPKPFVPTQTTPPSISGPPKPTNLPQTVPQQVNQPQQNKTMYIPGVAQPVQQQTEKAKVGIFIPGSAPPTVSQPSVSSQPKVNKFAPPPAMAPPPHIPGAANKPPSAQAPPPANKFAPPPSIQPPPANKFAPPPSIAPSFPQPQMPQTTPGVYPNQTNTGVYPNQSLNLAVPPPSNSNPPQLPNTAINRGITRSQTSDHIKQNDFLPKPDSQLTQFVHSTSQPVQFSKTQPFFKHRKPLIAMGFGGMMCCVENGNLAVTDIKEAFATNPIIKQINGFNFNIDQDKQSGEKFLSERVMECESADDSILWSTIRIRYRNQNKVDSQQFIANAKIQESPEYQLLGILSHSGISNVPTNYNVPSINPALVDQLQNIIASQGEQKALEYCKQNKLWDFALVISASFNIESLRETIKQFVETSLSPCPLQNILLAISGFAGINADTWRSNLATIMRHFTPGAQTSLIQMADVLDQAKMSRAAHVCRLLASEEVNAAPSPFSMIGSTWDKPNVSSIIMTQLSGVKGPAFLKYIVIFTLALADFGFAERAKDNFDKLSAIIAKNNLRDLQPIAQFFGSLISSFIRSSQPKKLSSKVDSFISSFVNRRDDSNEEQMLNVPRLPSSISIDFVEQTGISPQTSPQSLQRTAFIPAPEMKQTTTPPPPMMKPPQQNVPYLPQQDQNSMPPPANKFAPPPANQFTPPPANQFTAPPPAAKPFIPQQPQNNQFAPPPAIAKPPVAAPFIPQQPENNQNNQFAPPPAMNKPYIPQQPQQPENNQNNQFAPPPAMNKPYIPQQQTEQKPQTNQFTPPPAAPVITRPPVVNAPPQQENKSEHSSSNNMPNLYVPQTSSQSGMASSPQGSQDMTANKFAPPPARPKRFTPPTSFSPSSSASKFYIPGAAPTPQQEEQEKKEENNAPQQQTHEEQPSHPAVNNFAPPPMMPKRFTPAPAPIAKVPSQGFFIPGAAPSPSAEEPKQEEPKPQLFAPSQTQSQPEEQNQEQQQQQQPEQSQPEQQQQSNDYEYNDPMQGSGNDFMDPMLGGYDSYNPDPMMGGSGISYSTPVFNPMQPQQQTPPPKKEEDEEPPKPKKEEMKPQEAKPKQEEQKPKQEEQKEEKRGFFSSIFGRKKKSVEVDLSKQDNQMRYDPVLGRYVFGNGETNEPTAPPPPPSMSSIKKAPSSAPGTAPVPDASMPISPVNPAARRRATGRYANIQ